ncbi:hypothetical protein, partial [uncultured Actinomyces sp.]|uniref:hypothetical protein n=1 Tax=uncultured Actinomyces sp. TaxID=249061 RepID=UPI0028D6BBB4
GGKEDRSSQPSGVRRSATWFSAITADHFTADLPMRVMSAGWSPAGCLAVGEYRGVPVLRVSAEVAGDERGADD